jgi:hypothetical protein
MIIALLILSVIIGVFWENFSEETKNLQKIY